MKARAGNDRFANVYFIRKDNSQAEVKLLNCRFYLGITMISANPTHWKAKVRRCGKYHKCVQTHMQNLQNTSKKVFKKIMKNGTESLPKAAKNTSEKTMQKWTPKGYPLELPRAHMGNISEDF